MSTYQSVTGTGYKAIAQMNTERGLAEDERARIAGSAGAAGSPETSGAYGSAGLLAPATALPHWGSYPAAYPYPIDQNILPHIDSFLENGYTKEEMKMTNETKKILRDESIAVTATTVRVPVQGGHSESINVETLKPFTVEQLRSLMASEPGVVDLQGAVTVIIQIEVVVTGTDMEFLRTCR